MELESKYKAGNTVYNLWLLLFPILISEDWYIQPEGQGR